MKYLALDPSMTCTGWAAMKDDPDAGPDGRIMECGCITPEGSTPAEKRESLWHFLRLELARHMPLRIVIETPSEQRQGLRGYRQQSVMTGPQYGIAVGLALAVAMEAQEFDRERAMNQDSTALVYALNKERPIPPPAERIRIMQVSTNAWSGRLAKGQRLSKKHGVMVADDKKGGRVEAVKYFYGVDLLEQFCATKAGNVADAILLGRWVIQREGQR